ncbi:MAG: hypothetical protein ACR2NO_08515 [Chloroflexota bacterium]
MARSPANDTLTHARGGAHLDALWPDIERMLPVDWRGACVSLAPVTGRVSKVTLDNGRALAVKLAVDDTPVDREASVVRFLTARGCAVPEVVVASPGWLVTEWVGSGTIDDALQDGLPAPAAALVAAVRGVANALGSAAVTPASAVGHLTTHLAPWRAALPGALAWLIGNPHERLLTAVVRRATACTPEAGSLDYTARNVLMDEAGARVWLIDFAATGFDWTERRLAQYALSAGAARTGGVFRSALTAQVCQALGDPTGVDAHEVLLLLIAAAALRQVKAGRAHADRARAWRNVDDRKDSLLTLLRRSLCARGPAEALRAALR